MLRSLVGSEMCIRDSNTVDVWKNLLENEASVEFVRFYFYNKGWTDSVMSVSYTHLTLPTIYSV